MDKYIEVIKQVLPLLETIEEGIIHIQAQVKELRYEEAMGMLQDVIEGIASIEDALEPMMDKLPENSIELLVINLKQNIKNAANIYEDGRETSLEKLVTEEILPAFTNWKTEIEKVLKPYLIS